jgi:hypothetical protein
LTRPQRSFAFAALLAAATPSLQIASAEAVATGIWTKGEKGSSLHVQSGFTCPLDLLTSSDRPPRDDLETIRLQTVIVGSSGRPQGEEVGCEYEGAGGGWATVEIIKLSPNESVESRNRITRQRIKQQFPDALRDAEFRQLPPHITSPTGGRTYVVAYYNIRVGEQRAAVAAAGGEVAGWMITVVQFDFDKGATGLKLMTGMNWQRIVNSRRPR